MGDISLPTAADYAMHSAREARSENQALEARVAELENTVAAIMARLKMES